VLFGERGSSGTTNLLLRKSLLDLMYYSTHHCLRMSSPVICTCDVLIPRVRHVTAKRVALLSTLLVSFQGQLLLRSRSFAARPSKYRLNFISCQL
jgi:hypothetical protein